MISNNEYMDILKRIRVLLNRNLWLEAKEYLQIELDNLEENIKKSKKNE